MDKRIIETLKNMLPDDQKDQVSEVASVIGDLLEESKKELESEFNEKLEEAYAQLSEEKEEIEKVGLEGYEQAYSIIESLRNKLEKQRQAFEHTMEEQYE